MQILRLLLQLKLILSLAFGLSHNISAEEFHYPLAVVVDEQGTIFVADRKLPGIWKIKDNKPEIYFQGSKKFRTPLNAPRCLAIDQQGHLLAGDSSTREIYRFAEQGKPIPLTQGKIGIPMAIAVHQNGIIYVADLESRAIVTVPAKGGAPELLQSGLPVRGLTFDKGNNLIVVAHTQNQLLKITPDKKTDSVIKGRLFQFPHHVTLDAQESLYVADGYAKTIWKVPAGSDKPNALIKHTDMKNPVGLFIHNNKIHVADPQAKTIFVFNLSGQLQARIPAK